MSDHDNKCEVMLTPPDMNRIGLCLCKERALKVRLADKEILLVEAVEYGTGYKQAYDEAMANYQMALARLAVAERLLREWVADAYWDPRANLPDLVNRTRHAIGAARATDSAPAALCRHTWIRTYDGGGWHCKDCGQRSDRPAQTAPAVTCDHFLGQAVCEWCHGTGAIDAPTSADDPSCPECDGEGYV